MPETLRDIIVVKFPELSQVQVDNLVEFNELAWKWLETELENGEETS